MSDHLDEFEFFLDKPWSDGLPVVTPSEERVERMLRMTGAHEFIALHESAAAAVEALGGAAEESS